jgi:LacI family transcriptional regulator
VGAPTVYDVAERANVSIATVSRVYRNPDSVREQTRDRVLAVARELGYVPSGSARGLATRSTGVLGLCFPDHADPDVGEQVETLPTGEHDESPHADEHDQTLYADGIIRGMERAARRNGYALLIAASLADGPESMVASMAGRVDGFAVLARTVATADLELLARRLPVVMIAGPREIDHLDHVEVANRAGERELTTHLIARHGLRRLAFIGGAADSPDAQARFAGYQEARRWCAPTTRWRSASSRCWSGAGSVCRRTSRWSVSTGSPSAGWSAPVSRRSPSRCASSARPRWTCWWTG